MSPPTQSPTNGEIALAIGLLQQDVTNIKQSVDKIGNTLDSALASSDARLKALETWQTATDAGLQTRAGEAQRIGGLERWQAGMGAAWELHKDDHKTAKKKGDRLDTIALALGVIASAIGLNKFNGGP